MIRQFIKAWERAKETSSSGGKIFIRGAGNNGRMLLGDLAALGVKVSAFIDCNPTLVGSEVKSVPVISPDEVYTLATSSYFILSSVVSGDVYAELRCEMEDHGLTEGRDFADFGLNCDWRMLSDGVDFMVVEPVSYDKRVLNSRKLRGEITTATNAISPLKPMTPMPNIEDEYNFMATISLCATTYCSLHCAKCMNLIPYCSHPRHYDPAAIIGDLDKLLSVSRAGSLHIIGGEALLHPGLPEMLRFIGDMRHRENVGCVALYTNGTIVPSGEVLSCLARLDNAYVYISNYGSRSRKLSELTEACERSGVPTHVCSLSHKWHDAGNPAIKRNYSDDKLRHLFTICGDALCYQLYDGKLYPCSRAPILYEAGFAPPDDSAFLDVRNTPADELSEAVHHYLYDIPYISACNHCDGNYTGGREISRGSHK